MSTTLTVKGQVTIPKNIRDHLCLKPGDQIDFAFAEDGNGQLLPVRKASVRSKASKFAPLVGSRRKNGRTEAVMELLRGYAGDKSDPGLR